MSWGEAFGHAIGMYAMLFVLGIVFAIPVIIGYALATDGNMAGLALILASALAYHVCSLAIVIKGVSDAAGGNVAIPERGAFATGDGTQNPPGLCFAPLGLSVAARDGARIQLRRGRGGCCGRKIPPDRLSKDKHRAPAAIAV